MLKFIIKRVLLALPTFFGVTLVVYILSSLAPGSPADIIASAGNLSEEAYEALKTSMGLDKPILVRYLLWLTDLLQGNLGISLSGNQPVAYLLSQRIGPSCILAVSALLLALLVSIPAGVISAYKPYSKWDNAFSMLAFLGTAIPNFFLGLLVVYIFAVKLKLLPAQGMYTTGQAGNIASVLQHLILPTFVLSLQHIGNFIKQTRGSVLEVLNEEYIKTARSKGIKEHAVIIKHALRNALIPIVTSIGLAIPVLVGGSLVTEQIFSWPGIGSLLIQSISVRDYNVIMGVTVIVALVVLVTNIVMDVLYGFLDPRISE